MVVGTPATRSVISCNHQPSESNVVHDRIRPRQHQIAAITCVAVRVSAGHVQQAGTVGRGETVGGSSGSVQLSPSRGSTEMIGDGCPDGSRKVLFKGVGEYLLPTAQA
jgi:hypothetical protein